MTRSATRRAVPAGWLERVFSQGAQMKLLHHKQGWRRFGAGLFYSKGFENLDDASRIHYTRRTRQAFRLVGKTCALVCETHRRGPCNGQSHRTFETRR
jgi:hypothetical protein